MLGVCDRGVGEVHEQLREPALGGRVVLEDVGERPVPQRLREALPQRVAGPAYAAVPTHSDKLEHWTTCLAWPGPHVSANGPRVVGQAEIAADDVLQEAQGLVLDQLRDHGVEHGDHRQEALVGLAHKVESHVVQQDLLYNEDGNLRANSTNRTRAW